MHILLNRMKHAFPRLNEKAYTFADVERITRRERIKLTICEYDPDILGYFCTRKTPQRTKRFIVINSKLDEVGRTFIGLHELTHYFLHVPGSPKQWFYCRRNAERTRSKHDHEANAFALIAMVPQWMLVDLATTAHETLHPVLSEICVRRQKLFEKHGV